MHEMSLCESIVQVLEDQAVVHAYDRVKSVRLEIGALACAEPEAVRFAFDVCSRGTLAEGARLDIIEIEATAWCFGCGATVTIAARGAACPTCGGHQLQVNGGEDLKIKDMEVV